MLLAPALGAPPREIAERLGEELERAARRRASSASRWPGPGFLNLFMRRRLVRRRRCARSLRGRRRLGRRHAPSRASGSTSSSSRANPTGPMHRGAAAATRAYGDALARILEFAGHEVEREYYVNDDGAQVRSSASRSRRARAARSCPRTATRATTWPSSPRRSTAPPSCDADELARAGGRADDRAHPGDAARASACDFDACFSRARAARRRADRRARCERLETRATSYESEGALWLRTTDVRRRQGPRARALERRARPTSPPTSPTTRTSSSAATTG